MDLLLKDKLVIVTGGAKGIGAGIVRALAAEEAIPVIVGRKEADNLLLVHELEQLGRASFQVVAELTRPEDCRKAVEAVVARFGRLDGLVNNAGVNDGVGLAAGNYER